MPHRSFTTLAAAAILAVAGAAQADYRLTILHVNDLHSRIEPISKYGGACAAEDDEAGACFGGVARLKTFLDTRRALLAGQNVLTLDAGELADHLVLALDQGCVAFMMDGHREIDR